jgi:hypothetical protein
MVEAAISASKVAGSARISRMVAAGQDQDGGWLLCCFEKVVQALCFGEQEDECLEYNDDMM